MNSLLNDASNFWGKIASIIDIIPKLVYFMFAALTSGVDAMQALVRKLAGLDKYWQVTAGGDTNMVAGQDPLTEFVYGILGVGNSAPMYKALNTVFWSLAIFGLIMLVVATMIAIIKSHYNEDAGATSPWKYIYTAIKAILTFAITPVVVVLGFQLASFALRTLDQIVAGSADAGAIEGMYGGAADLFAHKKVDGYTQEYYTHYDFFGAQEVTTSTPFSGMLFKAAGYSSNRARNGQLSVEHFTGAGEDNSDGINGFKVGDTKIFLNGVGPSTEAEKLEYAATQVDYAFQMCLTFTTPAKYSDWKDNVDESVRIWSVTDLWMSSNIKGFSKWNVSTVWMFYDLWQFNYIVGFVGVFASFGIMVSIVFGLMTRLIKGAALFLIYPALLGLAPLDDFKAFKDWRGQFMKNVLMTFGAILGMNLLLLILPYVQNIEFFQWGVLNAIINVVLMVVGLNMAKDFISLVNGFVGGDDAVSAGEGMKGKAWESIKQGAGTTLKAGKLATMATFAGGKFVGQTVAGGVKGAKNMLASRTAAKRANNAKESAKMFDEQAKRQKTDLGYTAKKNAAETAQTAYNDALRNAKAAKDRGALKGDAQAAFDAGEAAAKKAGAKARKNGFSETYVKKLAEEAREKAIKKSLDKSAIGKEVKDTKNDFEFVKSIVDDSEKSAKKDRARADAIANKHGLVMAQSRNSNGQFGKVKYMRTRTVAEDLEQNGQSGIIKGVLKPTTDVGKAIGEGAKKAWGNTSGKDADGNEVKGTGILGWGEKIGKDIAESTSWTGVGKNIADAFLKTFQSAQSGMGLDKITKDLTGIVGELRQTTFKPKDQFSGKAGDDLTKDIAKKQQTAQDKTNEILGNLLKEIEKQNANNNNNSNSPTPTP